MNKYKNKKIVIWGLGLHGGALGVTKFLADLGAKLLVTDLRDAKTLKPTLQKLKKYKNIKYVLGEHREKDFFDADFIVANQAIKPNNHLFKKLKKSHKQILSEIGLFYEFNKAMVVGITGTKGKSTITALVYELLKQEIKQKNPFLANYNKVFLGGNIRKSVFNTLKKSDQHSIVVIELSSYQLEQAKYMKQSPHISIISNIMPEHLDWHQTMDNYIKAKTLIFKFQHKNDFVILPHNLKYLGSKAKSQVLYFNGSNQDAVYKFGSIFHIKDQNINKVLKNFKGLEGRQQFIAKINGVNFYNDTCATHPAATLYALKKFQNPIIIWGGVDKGADIKLLAKTFEQRKIRVVLFPGSASEKMLKLLHKEYRQNFIKSATSIHQAVQDAFKWAKKGDNILLSPGAASFNMFLNEFDRGKHFNQEVKKLQKQFSANYKNKKLSKQQIIKKPKQ